VAPLLGALKRTESERVRLLAVRGTAALVSGRSVPVENGSEFVIPSNFLLMPDGDKLDHPMRTIDQTTQEILDLASKHFNVPAGTLAPDDDFFKKLGIDSLQTLELLSRIENHFNIELPDYEVQGVSDFRTLASRIQSRL
jgi:acyl carrier protein